MLKPNCRQMASTLSVAIGEPCPRRPWGRRKWNPALPTSRHFSGRSRDGPGPSRATIDPALRMNHDVENPGLLRFGETPLTDPRSVGSSVLFHGLLVLLAGWPSSTSPCRSTEPARGRSAPRSTRSTTGPIAEVPGEGGGSPGEIGGISKMPVDLARRAGQHRGGEPRPTADALLAEILPGSQPLGPETLQKALPGPQTIGQGLIPGSGTGRRRGFGRRLGRRRRPWDRARHPVLRRPRSRPLVRLCDRLLGQHGQPQLARVAKRELLASLNQLPPDAEFSVIFYNLLPGCSAIPGPPGA